MRLHILEHRSHWLSRFNLKIIELFLGHVPGPLYMLTYRKKWFGNYFSDCFQEGMRRPTAWSKGEVELFAAFVSKLNQCVY